MDFRCTVHIVSTCSRPCAALYVCQFGLQIPSCFSHTRALCAGSISAALAASGKPHFPANMEQHTSNLGQTYYGCGHCCRVPWHTCFWYWLAILCSSRLFGWMLPHSSSSAEPCLQDEGEPSCKVFCSTCCAVLLNKHWHETLLHRLLYRVLLVLLTLSRFVDIPVLLSLCVCPSWCLCWGWGCHKTENYCCLIIGSQSGYHW